MFAPGLTLKQINVLCWVFFFALLTPLSVVLYGHGRTEESVDTAHASDFVSFFGIGQILNQYPAEKLYDYGIQTSVFTKLQPTKSTLYGPSPYPPYVAILFRPFARMPYLAAYALWLSISLILYTAGVAILVTSFFPSDRLRQSLIFCFALSFYPFTLDTLVNGQISAIGFLAMVLAWREQNSGHPIRSGLALSACLYKPTLLLLFLPMLLIGKRFKTLIGFAIGAGSLVLFATAVEGVRVWAKYMDLLIYFGTQTHSRLRFWKYVDLTAFSSSISGGRSWMDLMIILGVAGLAVFYLSQVWWKSANQGKPASALVWATTLAWTLLLNVYVPIYDSILVVPSLVATAPLLKNWAPQSTYHWFTLLWVAIFVSSWVTETIALNTGVQLITLFIAALGVLQLAMLRKLLLLEDHRTLSIT